MKVNKSNCYNCTERCVGCHSTCEKYKQYKLTNEAINKKRREFKVLERWR